MQDSHVKKNKIKWRDCALTIFFACVLCVSVVPSFKNIGNLPFQIFVTLFPGLVLALISIPIKGGTKAIGYGLCIFFGAMILTALVTQVIAQLNCENPLEYWIYTFYYDKPMTVALLGATVFSTITLVRLFSPIKEFYNRFSYEYKKFLKASSIGFLIFYFLLLIYGFIIIRTEQHSNCSVNFIPFVRIFEYFSGETSFYENFMYLCGNLLILLPFGFYLRLLLKKTNRYVILIIPILFSSIIEISQYVLKNGDCDIDDIILNTIGFYIGSLIYVLINFIRRKITGGKENTIFTF